MAATAKRSITLRGHKTSVSLERDFWEAIKQIAVANNQNVSQLIAAIADTRRGNLSSAIRVYVLSHYQDVAKGELLANQPIDVAQPPPLLHPGATDKSQAGDAGLISFWQVP